VKRSGFAIAVVVATLAASVVVLQPRAVAEDRIEQGRRMFMEQGCYGCHTVERVGTPIGPDLSRLGTRYAPIVIENWLRDPASQKPSAHMPRLELTEPQIKSIAAFLASLT
jgi:cytochrome c oxidase subunit II